MSVKLDFKLVIEKLTATYMYMFIPPVVLFTRFVSQIAYLGTYILFLSPPDSSLMIQGGQKNQ